MHLSANWFPRDLWSSQGLSFVQFARNQDQFRHSIDPSHITSGVQLSQKPSPLSFGSGGGLSEWFKALSSANPKGSLSRSRSPRQIAPPTLATLYLFVAAIISSFERSVSRTKSKAGQSGNLRRSKHHALDHHSPEWAKVDQNQCIQ